MRRRRRRRRRWEAAAFKLRTLTGGSGTKPEVRNYVGPDQQHQKATQETDIGTDFNMSCFVDRSTQSIFFFYVARWKATQPSSSLRNPERVRGEVGEGWRRFEKGREGSRIL